MIKVNRKEVEALLNDVQNDFTPPLSETVDLRVYSSKLVDNAIIIPNYNKKYLNAICAVYANDYIHRKAYLTMLAVRPENRGEGIAKKLIQQAEIELIQKGFKSLTLEVYSNNNKALFLYKSCGFSVHDISADSIFMIKYL
jgi:ribosomal protein S18 acetylase RimI-like enzyme